MGSSLLLLPAPLSDHRVRVGPGAGEGGVPLAGAVLGPDDVGDVLRHEGDGHCKQGRMVLARGSRDGTTRKQPY